MKYSVLIAVLLFSINGFSQCLSGNCKNGFGKYDFGFAIYEGNFVNEKPNGKGTMDYGGGEKFVGNFKDGQEDGDGILYKKNVPQPVTYTNGKVKIKTSPGVVIGGNAPTILGCVQGDCYNGFGIVKFESGNRYEGNFIYGIKSGEGKFYFASGNVFSGNFKDDVYTNGVFNYSKEMVSFTGDYNADGTPKSGDYYYGTNKATVTIVNGKITKVVNPVAERARKLAEEQSKPRSCTACGGAGMFGGGSKNVTVYHELVIKSPGRQDRVHEYANPSTRKEFTMPTECSTCRGTGQAQNQGMILNTGRY
jgi:hypothetical protein